jgi:hypothetical protein
MRLRQFFFGPNATNPDNTKVFFISRISIWLVIALLGVQATQSLTPSSFWFEPKQLIIAHAQEGEDPLIQYTRTIHRPFRATYSVTIRKMGDNGLEEYCYNETSRDYSPSAGLARHLTLSWLYSKKDCPLVPGTYVVNIHWRLFPPFFDEKDARLVSNVFEVRKKD